MRTLASASASGAYGFSSSITVWETRHYGRVLISGFRWSGNTGGIREQYLRITKADVPALVALLARAEDPDSLVCLAHALDEAARLAAALAGRKATAEDA
jgi:hypothetical protein